MKTAPPLAIDPAQRLRSHLAQFLGEFAQALFGCGRYAHSLSTEARSDARLEGLARLFHGMMGDRDELCLVRGTAEAGDLQVEGLLRDPVGLGDLTPTGVGTALLPRLATFFQRRGLACLRLQPGFTAEELGRFLQTLRRLSPLAESEASLHSPDRSERFRHLSFHRMGQLVEADRPIPWRVRLALSQLRSDLAEAGEASPPASHVDIAEGGKDRPAPNDPAWIGTLKGEDQRRHVIQRALCWVGPAPGLAHLLRHADLLAAAFQPPAGIALAKEIIAALPPASLGPVLAELARDAALHASPANGRREGRGDPYLQRILLHLAEATLALRAPGSEEGLAAFFRAHMVPVGDLTGPLRAFLLTKRLAQELQENPAATLARIREAPEAYAELLGPAVTELLRGNHIDLAQILLELALAFPAPARRVRETAPGSFLPILLSTLEEGTRDQRLAIAYMLVLLGPVAAEPMIELLARSPDRGVRRIACDVLTRMGKPALPALVAWLERPDVPWYVVRNLLVVTGTIREPLPVDLRSFLRHSHPRVREEAIQALAQVHGREAESALVGALRDPNPKVRARALLALGDVRSTHAGFLKYLIDALRRKALTEPEEDEQVQLHACAVVQRQGNIPYPGNRPIETTLEEALAVGPKGMLGAIWGGGFRPKSPTVRGALENTLAALRSPVGSRK